MQDLEAREKDWASNEASHLQAIKEQMYEHEHYESGSEFEVNAPSVDLSDIKSENESIYWEQKRGNVEDVDILIRDDRMFDHETLNEIKSNMRLFEKVLDTPWTFLEE